MAITDINPGDTITGAWVSAVQNNVGDAWSTYTLSLTASSSNPTKGNSTYSARYRMLNDHSVAVVIRVTIGSSFSVGSGFYTFSLPVTPADSVGEGTVGSCWISDASAGAEYGGIARVFTSGVVLETPKQDGTTTSGHAIPLNLVGAAFPMVPATSDEFRFSLVYEV